MTITTQQATIMMLAPANIITTAITPSNTTCTEHCDLTVDITWQNIGDIDETFIPTIKVNGTPTSLTSELLVAGASITHTFSLTGLIAGTYSICSDPDTFPCATITVLTPTNVISTTLTVDITDCIAPCTVNGTVSWTNTGGTDSLPTDLAITVNGSPTSIASAVTIGPGTTTTYQFSLPNLPAGIYTVQASPNAGTTPKTITVHTPANIIATAITPSKTTCISPCDLTVNVTWTNNGGVSGTFIPSIKIDDIPISPAQYMSESLAPGASVTHIFTVTGLTTGSHTICADSMCTTITVTAPVIQAGFGAAGMFIIAGLAIGALYMAKRKKTKES